MPRKRVDVNVAPAIGHVSGGLAAATARAKGHAALPFQLRLPGEVRAALDQAAAGRRSVNAEIVARLQASFAAERALGGPEMRWLVELAIASFTFAGRMRAPGDPNWLRNQEAYRSGLFALIDALLAGIPGVTPEEIAVEIEGLKSRLLTRLVQQEERVVDEPLARRKRA
jgi:hypothetical protein